MNEKERTDAELRERSLEIALADCKNGEFYETTGELIRAAQEVFEYLKNGTVQKKEVKKTGR